MVTYSGKNVKEMEKIPSQVEKMLRKSISESKLENTGVFMKV